MREPMNLDENTKNILGMVDHTLLKQTATWEEIRTLCDDAIRFRTASVCIPPCYVKQAKEYVKDAMRICTVIGFPNGNVTTETKVFELHRAGNLIVNNVFERALKGQDRDMLQCVHPYDLGEAHPFAMSYLSGFQAEKRDIEQNEVAQAVQTRINGYCQQLMKDTASGYSAVQIQNYNDKIDHKKWNYTLLPVWIVTYKYRGKILPFAINGQTGKTYGELPTSAGKLLAFAAIIAAALMALGLLGGLLFL